MSNPTVSFRISDYHLARGLRAIRILEPTWQLTTPAELIRSIFNDYIAKSEHFNNTPHDINPELLQEIFHSRANLNQNFSKQNRQNQQLAPLPQISKKPTKTPEQIAIELNQERIFNQVKQEAIQEAQAAQEALLNTQINATFNRVKPSEFHDPNITESVISSVTDFSPPPEWKNLD
jgi:hypothetical protein